MATALIFPGQGSQVIGMGKELYDSFSQAKDVFDEVDDALNYPLRKLIVEGPFETLTLTVHTQPALMAVSVAALRVLNAQLGLDFKMVAGHSLGEYSALVATKALSLSVAAQLLQQRGKAMQEAVPKDQGIMAAVLGLTYEQVYQVLGANTEGICEIANDNGPGQVVLSGHRAAVEHVMEKCTQMGAKKVVILPVSAPFHCTLMQPAADVMSRVLEEVSWGQICTPIVMNVTADFCGSFQEIAPLLIQQVTATVRWRESIEKMAQSGIQRFIEVGAGKILTGIGKRIVPHAHHYALNNPEDFDKLNQIGEV